MGEIEREEVGCGAVGVDGVVRCVGGNLGVWGSVSVCVGMSGFA